MHINFFDDDRWEHLLPFTFTRPVAGIRLGILTIAEKWQRRLGAEHLGFVSEAYLSVKFPKVEGQTLWINGSICPNKELVAAVKALKPSEKLVHGELLIAYYENVDAKAINFSGSVTQIRDTWDIFRLNGQELQSDFDLITAGRKSQEIPASAQVIGKEHIFLEKGAVVEHAILNATEGPIYLGIDSLVMDGAMVRGGLALCAHSHLKLGAKVYGPTTIGPHSKMGGELNNVVVFGYSNKAHDGFLGNAVIGEWCNIGADSNNSNLKNNYTEVRIWSYAQQRFAKTGLQFCGLMMGDHSKCGINTMFNTGTVVGVSANIFGSGFPRNYIPSFSWGGAQGFSKFKLAEAIEVSRAVYKRRGIELTQADIDILTHISEHPTSFQS
jgi:UDP-N-acetylglucosamine diphosphorylase/glucosamine-1-phosphate N-acetyltransferase